MAFTPPGAASGTSTSPDFVDLTSPSPSERRFMPVKGEAMNGGLTAVIDLTVLYSPRSNSGRELCLGPAPRPRHAVIDLTSSSPPRSSPPSQHLPIRRSPEPLLPQRTVDQHHDAQIMSTFYKNPGSSNYDPLSLLADTAELVSTNVDACLHSSLTRKDVCAASILTQVHRDDARLAKSAKRVPIYPYVPVHSPLAQEDVDAASILMQLHRDDAQLANLNTDAISTSTTSPPSTLTQEDVNAASILMQLHSDDARLAISNTDAAISDTDFEATVQDDTPYQPSAQPNPRAGWPSPPSPTEIAAARRGKLRAREI